MAFDPTGLELVEEAAPTNAPAGFDPTGLELVAEPSATPKKSILDRTFTPFPGAEKVAQMAIDWSLMGLAARGTPVAEALEREKQAAAAIASPGGAALLAASRFAPGPAALVGGALAVPSLIEGTHELAAGVREGDPRKIFGGAATAGLSALPIIGGAVGTARLLPRSARAVTEPVPTLPTELVREPLPKSRQLPAPSIKLPEETPGPIGPEPREVAPESRQLTGPAIQLPEEMPKPPAPTGEPEARPALRAELVEELGPEMASAEPKAGDRIELPVEPETAKAAREVWSKSPPEPEAQVEGADALRQLVSLTEEQKTPGEPYKPPTVNVDLRQLERVLQRNTVSKVESWADKVIQDKLRGTSANPFLDPEFLAAAVTKGALLFKRGVTDFAKWQNEMRQQFGRGLEEVLPVIYNQSKDYWEQRARKGTPPKAPPEEQPPVIEQATPATTPTATPSEPAKPPVIAPPGPAGPAEAVVQPPAPEGATAMKYRLIDQERAQRGLEPLVKPFNRTDEGVWQEAMAATDRDPGLADRLVTELNTKSRPISDVENHVLLLRKIDLRNQHADAVRAVNEAATTDEAAAAGLRRAALSDQLTELEMASRASGSERGAALRSLRVMANEDFELASMEADLRATAGGRRLTPRELSETERLARAYKAKSAALDRAIADYERRLREGDVSPRTRRPVQPDAAMLAKQAELERVRKSWREMKRRVELENRSWWQKLLDGFVRWERAFKLSSPLVFGKLTAAAVTRAAETATTEVAGGALGKVPGIAQVARQAPREGGLNVPAMAKGLASAFTKGMRDAWQTARQGASDLDLVYGEKLIDRDWTNLFGQLHGALKAPVKRAEFTLSLEKRIAHAMRNGVDVSDPMVQVRLATEALDDGYRSIFMQHGFASDMFNSLVAMMEKSKNYQPVGEIGARLLRFLLPIVRVPTNIVAETATGIYGAPMASLRTMVAAMKGELGRLDPKVADSIMRQWKKGSVGLGLIAIGFLNPESVGGYDWREKRQPGAVKTGGFQIGGVDIPRWLTHAPWFELMQFGATIRHVAEQHIKGQDKGVPEGLWAAAFGLIEEVPFIDEMVRIARAAEGDKSRTRYLGAIAKGTLVPQAVAKVAEWLDAGTKRQPSTVLEHIETGIPGLRQNVPEDTRRR